MACVMYVWRITYDGCKNLSLLQELVTGHVEYFPVRLDWCDLIACIHNNYVCCSMENHDRKFSPAKTGYYSHF